ncbi:MAG: hypothetical protein ACREUX_16780 [Burkholderiales bacterium]
MSNACLADTLRTQTREILLAWRMRTEQAATRSATRVLLDLVLLA